MSNKKYKVGDTVLVEGEVVGIRLGGALVVALEYEVKKDTPEELLDDMREHIRTEPERSLSETLTEREGLLRRYEQLRDNKKKEKVLDGSRGGYGQETESR